MIKNKPEAYGISSDNLLCMVQELETFVEDIHSISVVCDNDVIFSKMHSTIYGRTYADASFIFEKYEQYCSRDCNRRGKITSG